MAEELVLTDPVVEQTTTNKYRVMTLTMSMEAMDPIAGPGWVEVVLRDNNDAASTYYYKGLQASNMIKALNTANCSVKSMQKRVLEKLTADGQLPAGAVTGSPDPPVVLREVVAEEEDNP